MTRLAFAVAAIVLSSTLAVSEAEAKGPSGGSKGSSASKSFSKSSSHFHHNHHFHHRHRDYRSWSHYCWYPQYGCYCSYCPTACEWYYYCQPRGCYLPFSQIRQYPPTPTTNVNVNVNNNNNQNVVGGGPALQVGAQAVPSGFVPPTPGLPTGG